MPGGGAQQVVPVKVTPFNIGSAVAHVELKGSPSSHSPQFTDNRKFVPEVNVLYLET
jgi:hypothetical protein